MKLRRSIIMFGVSVVGMTGLLTQGGSRAIAADAGDPYDQSGVEVLTRGPIHEAFAEPNSYNPMQGVVIPQEPPAAFSEIPPDEKPSGDALWIPGYFQWDTERSDFIWISGIWRVPPPGCSWVPGYWTAVANGWTWTPGFWISSTADEVTYLPHPPKSLEIGPSSPAPSADHIWAPGCWVWTNNRYAWRPGYWVQARPDWVWSPAYYVDTPRGSVYIDGFWDWTIDRRGVLFAPAYIRRSVWEQPNYVYSPTIVIQIGLLTANLFISPRYGHYYFGDYYDTDYSKRGIYPWFDYHKNHHGYDPIYAHERWSQSRTDSHWEQQVRENYDYRRQHADARPARTYSSQAAFVARAPERERNNMLVAAPLSQLATRHDAPVRFEKINSDQRKSLGGQEKNLANYRSERAKWESNGRQPGNVAPTQAQSQIRQQTIETHQAQPAPVSTGQRENVHSEKTQSAPEPIQQQPRAQSESKHEKAPSVKSQGKQGSSREAKIKPVAPESQPLIPQKVSIPRSPIVGKPLGTPDKDGNPPSRPVMGRSDANNHAKPAEQNQPDHKISGASASKDSHKQGKKDNSNQIDHVQ